ncbi:hypothetical protein DSCOOX_15220 [Desulfosarcina ovata subsp. ovata]|uniref:Uncharacterized protein n=1 Tax=Desulfosarcina ovata subsp. ovata TaxID=2752305 RepID=A0A5K8A6V6_9BACT|nr:hypothetical protein DSCOOX_15220 [Desulfosarcina ovata subsp. ovata]
MDLERFGLYDHDVVFDETPDEANRLANEADILHLHNYLDYDSHQFAPIDFGELLKAGKRIVRHYHSTPDWIAEQMGISEEKLLACTLPSLVIAQYPERFFARSHVVPNMVPHSDPLYSPIPDQETEFDLFFSPTKSVGAFERRWDTKAAPEVTRLIHRVAERTGCTFKIMSGRPLDEVLRAKQRARIVIDDLVTGSYHLTGLEGLAQGKPVLSFLDERCQYLLRYFSGSEHCPFVNVRLEDAETVLLYLLENPDACETIGQAGYRWLLSFWNEEKLIRYFERAYEELTENPHSIRRQPALYVEEKDRCFHNLILPDLIFRARTRPACN